MTRTPLPAATYEQVMVRDAHTCRWCSSGLRPEVHHRQGRGGKTPHRLSNLIVLCSEHHRYVTEHPEWAYAIGLSVRRIGLDEPDEVPYYDSARVLWALNDDGDRWRLSLPRKDTAS